MYVVKEINLVLCVMCYIELVDCWDLIVECIVVFFDKSVEEVCCIFLLNEYIFLLDVLFEIDFNYMMVEVIVDEIGGDLELLF